MEHEIFREEKFTLQENDLIGKVHSCYLRSSIAREKKGEIAILRVLGHDKAEFNEYGLLIQRTHYSTGKKSLEKPLEDTVTFRVCCIYNKNNQLVSNITTKKNSQKIIYSEKIEYDDMNRIKSEISLNNNPDYNKSSHESYYIYHDKSYQIHHKYNGNTSEDSISEYDYTGRELNDGWIYDDVAGTKSYYHQNGALTRITYDKSGNELEKLWTLENGNTYDKDMYEYDEFNNLIRHINEHEGEFCYEYLNTYNKSHHLILSIFNNKRGARTHTFIYEYDKHGNWISQKHYEDSKLSILIERQITYYN